MHVKSKFSLMIVFLVFSSFVNSGDVYKIDKATVNASGGQSDGGNYQIKGSLGQPDASTVIQGGQYGVNGGIWSQSSSNDIIFKNGFEF